MKQKLLEQSVFTSVFHLSNKLQAEGDKLSNELTLKQWFLLLLLYKGHIKNPTVNDLALEMGVTRQSMKKMVDILEKNGYLSVEKSSSDSRALCISPTTKAYDFFQKNKLLGKMLLNKVFSGITQDELTTVLWVLQKMQTNLQAAGEADE